jgi:hypothetical protein
MKESELPQRGVWQKDWASFLSERGIPESEKYLVLAMWEEEDEKLSCRYPVRATSSEEAIRCVEDYDKSKDRPVFTGADAHNVNFTAVTIESVHKSTLDHLSRRDRGSKMLS